MSYDARDNAGVSQQNISLDDSSMDEVISDIARNCEEEENRIKGKIGLYTSLNAILKDVERFLVHADWGARHAKNEIVAFFIAEYKKRKNWMRPQNQTDDYYKAEYLNYLADYLGMKVSVSNAEFEKLVEMVYSIFEHAFFLWMAHPQRSDLDCFTAAERYYCNEKAIEYLAYFEYQKRQNKGIPGDANADYFLAEKKFIAERCKSASPGSSFSV